MTTPIRSKHNQHGREWSLAALAVHIVEAWFPWRKIAILDQKLSDLLRYGLCAGSQP